MSLLTYPQAPAAEEATETRTMIVGYDGSDAARSAFEEALLRAGPDDRIAVVHAYPAVSSIMARPYYDQAVIERQYEARRLLRHAKEQAAGTETEISYEMHEGAPAAVLARLAQLRNADEIIVGTRGLGRFRGAIHSVSQNLMRRARRPVLAVPAAEA
jgi:nucleotide-binding universal stress UspA family protein